MFKLNSCFEGHMAVSTLFVTTESTETLNIPMSGVTFVFVLPSLSHKLHPKSYCLAKQTSTMNFHYTNKLKTPMSYFAWGWAAWPAGTGWRRLAPAGACGYTNWLRTNGVNTKGKVTNLVGLRKKARSVTFGNIKSRTGVPDKSREKNTKFASTPLVLTPFVPLR